MSTETRAGEIVNSTAIGIRYLTGHKVGNYTYFMLVARVVGGVIDT